MLRKSLALALLVVALASSPQAAAGPSDDGVAALLSGDYVTALRLLRPLADQGDASAQFYLGFMYDKGQGVPQEYARAVFWYRKSAEQGDADAQNNLGFMYSRGQGVPQDYAQAASWYRKAAEQGDALAQNNLSLMYFRGRGVPQDSIQAHMWVNLSASRETDPEERSNRVKLRDLIAAKMTREQIATAQRLAREWKPKGR